MHTVVIVGAGPAGLFAAQKIASAGHQVAVLNRDIKPGGLAEYGIYPLKDKMKAGLRKQFWKILGAPNVHYFGHVPVGTDAAISIDDLRELNPAALVFSVGAQGTKNLGLPGEYSRGVYSAKNFVYHYNLLPPFASQDFSTGRRIAIIGMGNVAVDIARWVLEDDLQRKTEELIIVARRGPFEAKFDEKEFAHIEMHLDHRAFQEESERVRERLSAVGQDIAKLSETTFPILAKSCQETRPRLLFRFLSSPQSIHADASGRIDRLTVSENVLVARDGGLSAKATDKTAELEVDTMIFAIGDVVDPKLGLPYGNGAYTTNPEPADSKRAAYEVFDKQSGRVLEGMYMVGWARKASEGLVGVARFDAEQGATHVLSYLEGLGARPGAKPEELRRRLERKALQVVTEEDLRFLAGAEEEQAKHWGTASFKFADDATMLAAIEAEKRHALVEST